MNLHKMGKNRSFKKNEWANTPRSTWAISDRFSLWAIKNWSSLYSSFTIFFKDSLNCFSAQPGQWLTTMERQQRISEEKLIEMWFIISLIFENHHDYAASSRRMCSRVGFKGLHE